MSEPSSAPSSASVQSPLSPSGLAQLGPTSRPQSGIGPSQYHPLQIPGPSSKHARYTQSYYSPPLGQPQQPPLPGYHEISHGHASYPDPGALPISAPMPSHQGQKRAYRQRRKDPSCDACRERKVKCDATESSSCTECKSRNVTCQFTKETNKRMTSIKQNQDLSKELASAQAEIERLRSLALAVERSPGADPQTGLPNRLPVLSAHQLPSHQLHHLPVLEQAIPLHGNEEQSEYGRPAKRRKLVGFQEHQSVVSNMANFGQGIFKSPYPQPSASPSSPSPPPLPKLPPKDVGDALLRQYKHTIHPMVPIIPWQSFQESYENGYRAGSLDKQSSVWSSLLFAVLACGAMHQSRLDAQRYLDYSRSLMDLWTEDLTLDHARAALLNCMVLVESNRKSAGWVWLGLAVRISFDIGLDCEAGLWTSFEQEMRRRVWWSIYACDCLLSLELGRAAMIKEEDCNVRVPSLTSEDTVDEEMGGVNLSPSAAKWALLPALNVIGPISRLVRLLKSAWIGPEALMTYDTHFDQVLNGFPVHRRMQAKEYIDPIDAIPTIYLQNARLILHRHNLSPLCDPATRSKALDSCAQVAKDTARLLSRCMLEPSSSSSDTTGRHGSWRERLVSAVSAFTCTHIWRCTLVLLFRLDFDSALVCSRYSQTLGDSRPVNTACGRYLDFFLSQLLPRTREKVQLDTDEEMIAYVSGDLQGNFESSWIWQEQAGKGGPPTDAAAPTADSDGRNHLRTSEGRAELNGQSGGEWAGWDQVVTLIEELQSGQEQAKVSRKLPNQDFPSPTVNLAPLKSSLSPLASTPRDRLSIKDLL